MITGDNYQIFDVCFEISIEFEMEFCEDHILLKFTMSSSVSATRSFSGADPESSKEGCLNRKLTRLLRWVREGSYPPHARSTEAGAIGIF